MAAPKFAPVPAVDDARGYESPDHVPDAWLPVRPAEVRGFQPSGDRMGFQGPDQGFALRIANTLRPKLHVGPGESVDDAIRGCLGIALRRASMYSRAPVVHDLTIAFTAWGFLDPSPPADLVALRVARFAGLANPVHSYDRARMLVDGFPEATLRMTPQAVTAAYPARWAELVGA
jgi:hypothetical protein